MGGTICYGRVNGPNCANNKHRNQAHQVPITYDMLVGRSQLSPLGQQLSYPLQAYQQISIVGTEVWRSLPTLGTKGKKLT